MTRIHRLAERLIVVACSIAGLSNQVASGQTSVLWKFEPEGVLRYKLVQKIAIDYERPIRGADTDKGKVGQGLSLAMSMKVSRVIDDGSAEIELKISHVRMTFIEPSVENLELVYDSRDPMTVNNIWSGMMDAFVPPLIGEPYLLRMDRRGRVVEAKLPKRALEAWSALEKEHHMPVPVSQGYPIFGHSLFTERGIKDLFASVAPTLPEGPLEVGSTWKRSNEWADEGFSVALEDTYRLAKVGAKLATFAVTTEVRPKRISRVDVVANGREGNAPVKPRVDNFSGDATLSFDPVGGFLLESSRHQSFHMSFPCRNDMPPYQILGTATFKPEITASLRVLSADGNE